MAEHDPLSEPVPPPELNPVPEQTPAQPATRYERSDVGLYWFKILLVGFLVLGAIIQGSILWFQKQEQSHQEALKKSKYAFSSLRPRFPSRPRLEPLENVTEIDTAGGISITAPLKDGINPNSVGTYPSLEEKAKTLNTNPDAAGKSLVHIPIDRAMHILVMGQGPPEYQLKSRPEPTGKKASEDQRKEDGLLFGGGPNSGRIYRKEK